MIPRARIDIGYSDLVAGAAALLSSKNSIDINWPPNSDVLPCLSVRSAFDLYLRALDLPAGSEVLLSAVTIRDMATIIRAHNLVPVPLDVDPDTLAPSLESLSRLRTPQSRVLLLAHLFGAWSDFRGLIDAAHQHGLLVVEDCAQSAGAGEFTGDVESDLRLFSYGPIKTETALGGGLAVVRDPAVAQRMREIQQNDPLQTSGAFGSRLMRYTVLHTFAQPTVYTAFVNVCRILGRSHDDVISASTRGFPGPDLIRLIRRRPCAAQLSLLSRRVNHPMRRELQQRIEAGKYLDTLLDDAVGRPGKATRKHTYWLFPVLVREPDELMHALWREGIDATRGATSLAVIEAPQQRPDADPRSAREWMSKLLFVPCYASVPQSALRKLAQHVNAHARSV